MYDFRHHTAHSQLYKVPYHPKYRRLFSDAFDAYLEVIRVIGKRVRVVLGHNSPDWRVLNACPACSYEVSFSLCLSLIHR
jgi:hypothetical protein